MPLNAGMELFSKPIARVDVKMVGVVTTVVPVLLNARMGVN
jgi:hypothetical protein